jgi:hypothetical protein
MWKPEHRRAADRTGFRYPGNRSDAEWLIAESMIRPAKRGGRRRSVNVREVLNGLPDFRLCQSAGSSRERRWARGLH